MLLKWKILREKKYNHKKREIQRKKDKKDLERWNNGKKETMENEEGTERKREREKDRGKKKLKKEVREGGRKREQR